MTKIHIGIIGYGNLGRGVVTALETQEDMELKAIFSRRGPEGVDDAPAGVKVEHVDQIEKYKDIDVMILCGGSAKDLPEQTPHYSQYFNTVDSFDNHAQIPEHYKKVDQAAGENGHISVISVGWDPGLFSMNRLTAEAILPKGNTYTFWGKGLSQGHSDAVRRVEGVKDGVQYTLPDEAAMERVRAGENPDLSTGEKHRRQCFVVLEEGADEKGVAEAIQTMPDYFADYETEVNFISQAELDRDHQAMPHGGKVMRSAKTGQDNLQLYEFSLSLDSNPEFTASVLVAYARAAYKINQRGEKGARTIFDIALADISPKSHLELLQNLL